MFRFKSNKQKQQQEPPTSPGDNTYTRQLHPTKYGRVQTIDSRPFDEMSDNLLLTSNEDGSLVESELSTNDQVAPSTPAADIVDELDVLGNTTNDKLNKEDLLKLANKEEEESKVKKEDLLDNISIFSVKDDSFSVTDGDESTAESAKSGSTRSGSTRSSNSGKSKGSGRSSVKSRLSIRSNKSKSRTLQSVNESNVMSDKQANDAYNKLWHNNSNSSQKSGAAEEGGGSTSAASQTSEKSQKKKGSAADAQSLDNTFEEDGQSVYSSSYISVYSAAATERSSDSFMSKKSIKSMKSSKNDDVNADKNIDTDAVVEEGPKDEEEKKEEVSAARVVVDTHSALEKKEETPSEESEAEQKKKTPSLPLFNKSKKNLKSKRFFGKNKDKKNASSDDIEDNVPLPVHVKLSDEEVEITYGSSLPSKEKSTKEDSMARTTSNTTAPTVESKEEEDEEELEKVVPFTVSHSYYGAGAEDEDDGGFFGKLLSCTGVPQCNGGVDGEFDNDMLADQVKQTTDVREEGETNELSREDEDDDDEEEAYLNVEIFEDGNSTRIGYFMESADEDDDQANDTSDDRSINMRARSKVILKTKVPSGSEDDVVDDIANKLQQQEQPKDTTEGNNLDNSLKSKKKNVLRMKLLKRLNKKETGTN